MLYHWRWGKVNNSQNDSKKTVMQVLADETGGKSYKAHKYGLDHAERPFIDYSEDTIIWEKTAETDRTIKNYVPLEELAHKLSMRNEQYLTYFLDGSRRVYKVDDHAYVASGGRSVIYPIVAGQIGVGCCKRENKVIKPDRFMREIVISVPNIADADGRPGFFKAMAIKLSELPVLQRMGIEIKNIIPYSTKADPEKFEDRGTAVIQDEMIRCEKEMVAELVKKKMLDSEHYLVKDGSLEYRPTKDIISDKRKSMIFKNNYNYVLGVSKNFNPEICRDISGKPNPGYIADLPLYHRTPVACYKPFYKGYESDIRFAVWYIRLRDKSQTRTAFDGVVKVEKMLVTHDENEYGIDSELVNMLSALLINERNPVCYGVDLRWANHIYPIYLTETYVKSKYLSAESFLHLF